MASPNELLSRSEVTRREFLKRSVTAAAVPVVPNMASGKEAHPSDKRSSRPNVVIIHADQMRWDVVGAYGLNPTGLTPNLDAMAKRGTLFTQLITNAPVCAPSRACLWTGEYPAKHGVWMNEKVLSTDATTIATVLRQEGYSANYIGKWHLAPPDVNGPVPAQNRGGFLDFWQASNVLEFTSQPYEGDLYDADGKPIHFSGIYRVDFMTKLAVDFLRQRQEKPFLLAISYIEPHFQDGINRTVAPTGYAARYTNPFVPEDLRFFPGDWQRELPDYYGCVAKIDEAVGTILATLRELRLEDNTIVVFISDHGNHFKTRNTEDKRSAHESSVHVPLIIQGPKFDRSRIVDQLIGMVDITPTILQAIGISVPSSMQGNSAMPLLDGNVEAWRNEVFIQEAEFMVMRAVRTERWTYVVGSPVHKGFRPEPFSDQYVEYQLYDLYADPHQLVNLAGRAGTIETAERLRQRLMARMKEVGDRVAQVSEPYFPYP